MYAYLYLIMNTFNIYNQVNISIMVEKLRDFKYKLRNKHLHHFYKIISHYK